MFTVERAALWCDRGLALAIIVSIVELLQVRAAFSDHGVWRFVHLRREYQALPAPLRVLATVLLPYRSFVVLLGVQLVCALLVLTLGWRGLVPVLCSCQLAICVRFRGAYNGGSDAMLVLIALASSVAVCSKGQPMVARACLLYVAVQLTLSYAISGLSKLKEPGWRDGSALHSFLAASAYPLARWLTRHGSAARNRALAYLALAFECSFPLAWLDPRFCLGYLLAGCVFHIVNTLLFGLNRFLFAWLAAYPALLCCSQ